MMREPIRPMRQMTRLADVPEGAQITLLGKSLYLARQRGYYSYLWPSQAAYRCAANQNDPYWLVKAASWSHFVELPAAED